MPTPLYEQLLLTTRKSSGAGWRAPAVRGRAAPAPGWKPFASSISASNYWAEFVAVFHRTRPSYQGPRRPKACFVLASGQATCYREPK
jgi:hypothetical protein